MHPKKQKENKRQKAMDDRSWVNGWRKSSTRQQRLGSQFEGTRKRRAWGINILLAFPFHSLILCHALYCLNPTRQKTEKGLLTWPPWVRNRSHNGAEQCGSDKTEEIHKFRAIPMENDVVPVCFPWRITESLGNARGQRSITKLVSKQHVTGSNLSSFETTWENVKFFMVKWVGM